MVGGARTGTKVWNVTPSYVVAGFLVRGQASSFDSQASITFAGREGRAWVVCPLNMVRGNKRGRPSSVAQERVRLQEAQTENEKRRGVNEWMDGCIP